MSKSDLGIKNKSGFPIWYSIQIFVSEITANSKSEIIPCTKLVYQKILCRDSRKNPEWKSWWSRVRVITITQVMCEVILENFTGCERRESWSGVCRTSMHMILPEPQRRCDGAKNLYPRNILVLRSFRHLDRLINPKQNINSNNDVWGDVWKAHSRHLKLNLASWRGKGKAPTPSTQA